MNKKHYLCMHRAPLIINYTHSKQFLSFCLKFSMCFHIIFHPRVILSYIHQLTCSLASWNHVFIMSASLVSWYILVVLTVIKISLKFIVVGFGVAVTEALSTWFSEYAEWLSPVTLSMWCFRRCWLFDSIDGMLFIVWNELGKLLW